MFFSRGAGLVLTSSLAFSIATAASPSSPWWQDKVYYDGRWDYSIDPPASEWSGSSFLLRAMVSKVPPFSRSFLSLSFSNCVGDCKLELGLTVYESVDPNEYNAPISNRSFREEKNYEIDSQHQTLTYEWLAIGTNLSSYTFSVTKLTESGFQDAQGFLQLSNVSLHNAWLIDPPTPSKDLRKLLFMGASITAGYGVDGPYDCRHFKAKYENIKHSFAYLTAAALNARAQFVAFSGKVNAGNTTPFFTTSMSTSLPSVTLLPLQLNFLFYSPIYVCLFICTS